MPEAAQDPRIDELLAGLNPPQRDAVVHGEGPLLILAGAGSGKTRVLTHRIAYLMRTKQARADEILAITFTNKAAQEMRERVELLVGRATRAMWVMTFHSACARMLRADAHRLGYTRQFTIYDAADQRRLIKRCLDDLDIDAKRFTPRAMQSQISDAKNKLRSSEDYRQLVGSYFEQTVADVYEQYERELHRMNAMDFDDLLVRSVNLLELFQEVRDRYSAAFRWILVDEYQDTNHAQYRWLQLLGSEHRNVAVVGDDDQCLVEGTPITMGDGSIKPIEEVRLGDEVLSSLRHRRLPARRGSPASFRRSDRSGHPRSRRAAGGEIVSTPEHTHFAGYRVGMTPPMHMTYLMRRARHGLPRRVGPGRSQPRRQVAWPASSRAMPERADAAWVVSTHDTAAEAQVAETLLSLPLRLPTVPFVAVERRRPQACSATRTSIDEIFASVDTERGGLRLLHDEGLWPEDAHHLYQGFDGASAQPRPHAVRATEAARRPLHTLSLGGRDEETREALESLGLERAQGPPRMRAGWRADAVLPDFGDAMDMARRIQAQIDVDRAVRRPAGSLRAGQTNSLPFIHASSVRPGMVMFTDDGGYDIVESVERDPARSARSTTSTSRARTTSSPAGS